MARDTEYEFSVITHYPKGVKAERLAGLAKCERAMADFEKDHDVSRVGKVKITEQWVPHRAKMQIYATMMVVTDAGDRNGPSGN